MQGVVVVVVVQKSCYEENLIAEVDGLLLIHFHWCRWWSGNGPGIDSDGLGVLPVPEVYLDRFTVPFRHTTDQMPVIERIEAQLL